MTNMQAVAHPDGIYPLMKDIRSAPPEYIRDVAHVKRFLERWVMDPLFRDSFRADADAALAELGVALSADQVRPVIDNELYLRAAASDIAELSVPVMRYWAFLDEKRADRRHMRAGSEPAGSRRYTAWWRRQVNRCRGELGLTRAELISHAPAAFELSQGCTVGCWFCGVAAPRFESAWRHTADNAALWRGVLGALSDVAGPAAREAFLYWATEPLDNPDYEKFFADFHAVLGARPRTTTAVAHRDIDRTRGLLELSQSLGPGIDRFSIIALSALRCVHAAMSPEEMLMVDCLPQNPESAIPYPKSNAGRARRFAEKRAESVTAVGESATIACVSGFLLNMMDRSVRLVTPCDASDRWPDGYWIIDQATFGTAAELADVMRAMIDAHMLDSLAVDAVVRLRPDVRAAADGETVHFRSRGLDVTFDKQPDAEELAAVVSGGAATAAEIADRHSRAAGVTLAESFGLLDQLFALGMLDEEPPGRPETIVGGAA